MNAHHAIQQKPVNPLIIIVGVLVVLLCLIMLSCKPVPVQHTVHHTDTIIERERLVPIKVEGTHVTQKLSAGQLDSLTAALKNLPAGNRVIYYTDPKLKTQLSFAIDSIGRLVIQCRTLEALYWEKLKEKDRIIERKEFELREQQKTFGQKLSTFFTNGIWFIVLALAAFTGINWLINRKRA